MNEKTLLDYQLRRFKERFMRKGCTHKLSDEQLKTLQSLKNNDPLQQNVIKNKTKRNTFNIKR